ncbi:MAG: M1 family peptidase [Ectothiorhodospiraceae bacterium]|nr:M1 family peptidase [Ectothiorhodospiraceae bacterium]
MPSSPTLVGRRRARRLLALLALATAVAVRAQPPIRHALEVEIEPRASLVRIGDTLELPRDHPAESRFVLGAAFTTPRASAGWEVRPDGERAGGAATYRLVRGTPHAPPPRLEYEGRWAAAADSTTTPVGPDGAFLSGSAGWYPRFADELVEGEITVRLPAGWRAVAQGTGPAQPRPDVDLWRTTRPQDELTLVAGPYHLTERTDGAHRLQVWLRAPDPRLAQTYLDASADAIARYERLLGPYPDAKFAVVESFFESGYGMPSYTLLGPRVMRLPFVPRVSLPHEVVHCWFGNGVFIDPSAGNWAEGLTAYLADHLAAEVAGNGARHRREALQKYRSFVDAGRDFPLTAFRARHDQASMAVGYGKAMLLFHMLRTRLGDATFVAGLRALYRDHLGARASFDDVRRAFEGAAGIALSDFFTQWTSRSGAPALALEDVRVTPTATGSEVTGTLVQRQAGDPWSLSIPIALSTTESAVAAMRVVESSTHRQGFAWAVAGRVTRVDVDPAFDLFRQLEPEEVPRSLGDLFGARRTTVVLPALAEPAALERYRALAGMLARGGTVRLDSELASLPAGEPAWVLGWENRHRPPFVDDRGASFGDSKITRDASCAAATTPEGAMPQAWIGCDDDALTPALGRRLGHYARRSFVTFARADGRRELEGEWPTGRSALTSTAVESSATQAPRLPERPHLIH